MHLHTNSSSSSGTISMSISSSCKNTTLCNGTNNTTLTSSTPTTVSSKNLSQLVYFFFGLLEGNGSIQVNHWKQQTLQYRIIIKLKYTPENYYMLSLLRDNLQLMNLHVRNNCVLLVEDRKDKLLKLLHLFSLYNYTFITFHKYSQYLFFTYCIKNNITYSEYKYIKDNFNLWLSMQNLPADAKGAFREKASLILELPYFPNWLCGFTEAEGCFSIRQSKNHSFSIGQKNGLELLTAIKDFFEIPNKIREINSATTKSFYLLETYNGYCLNNVITFYTNPQHIGLLGSKKTQLAQFISVIQKKA